MLFFSMRSCPSIQFFFQCEWVDRAFPFFSCCHRSFTPFLYLHPRDGARDVDIVLGSPWHRVGPFFPSGDDGGVLLLRIFPPPPLPRRSGLKETTSLEKVVFQAPILANRCRFLLLLGIVDSCPFSQNFFPPFQPFSNKAGPNESRCFLLQRPSFLPPCFKRAGTPFSFPPRHTYKCKSRALWIRKIWFPFNSGRGTLPPLARFPPPFESVEYTPR